MIKQLRSSPSWVYTLVGLLTMAGSTWAQPTLKVGSATRLVGTGAVRLVYGGGTLTNNGSLSLASGQLAVAGPTTYAGSGSATVATALFNHPGSSRLSSQLSVTSQAILASSTSLNANGQLYLRTDQFPSANLVNNGILTGTVLGLVTNATVRTGTAGYSSTLSTNVSGTSMRYQWQASPDNTAFSDVPGATSLTYTATVSDRQYYRCRLTTTNSPYVQVTPWVELTATPAFSLTVSATPNPVCVGSPVSLAAMASNGTAPYTYSWLAPVGAVLSATTGTIISATLTTPGEQTFTVTATGGDRQTTSMTVRVQGNASPLSLTTTTTRVSTAGGRDGTASVSVSGGTPGYSYDWTPGNPSGDGTSAITSLSAGSYSVTVTDSKGCTGIASLGVTTAPDLTVLLYTTPSTQYGLTAMSVVVEVFELNGTASTGLVSVWVSKDPKIVLSFDGSSTFVGGRLVQNGSWTFDGTSNPDAYILTTKQGLGAGSKLSVGLTGTQTPGGTQGSFTLSAVISGVAGDELKQTNNMDSDKVEYFRK